MNELRLAEVMGALSIASDLGAGQAAETSLSSTILATRLGRLLGLSEQELSVIYYTCLLRYAGCTSTAVEQAALAMGEDSKFVFALNMCDWTKPKEVEKALRKYLDNHLPSTFFESVQL